MRFSQLFFKTFKEAPSDADIPSHQLLERAGYIKRLARGHYTYTPIMLRVLEKMKSLIRHELSCEGAQEILMPQMQPKSIWEQSGRWAAYKAEKLTYIVTDRDGHEHCLGPTHEEAVTHLVKNWITSYKQLPLNLFQISNKFRDEIRPRFGLMRSKEFIMKDAYSFSATQEQSQAQYEKMRRAYKNILERLDLSYVIVQADSGKIGTGRSEEFQVLADIGEDSILTCEDLAFNSEKAPCTPPSYSYPQDDLPMEKFATPGVKTIQEQMAFVGKSPQLMLKTLVYKLAYEDRDEYIAVGIRADRNINSVKLVNHFEALEVALADQSEVKEALNLDIGFIGPVNCPIEFIADNTCRAMHNFMCGANQLDYHYRNVQWDRDVKKPSFYDFCQAEDGDLCPFVADGRYKEKRGIEVGHIFNLGDKYSVNLQALFQSVEGRPLPLLMGCYGMGVGRCIQAAVEQKYDDKGIIWPVEIAPFHVLITPVNAKDEDQMSAVEKIYEQLLKLGLEVVIDDRKERLGFKLKDSDLIGIPCKMIIGKNFLSDREIEIEPRVGDKSVISQDYLKDWVLESFPHLRTGCKHA